MVGKKLALWEIGKKQLCGYSLSYQAETLEGPPGRISRLGAPRSGINFNRQGTFPSEPRKFQETLAHLAYPTEQTRSKECVHVAVAFLFRLILLPSSPGSGITALKKGTLRSAYPGAWDMKFAGCGMSNPPSGKKRQQAEVCLTASI